MAAELGDTKNFDALVGMRVPDPDGSVSGARQNLVPATF